jgi:cytochrome c oxidase subunit III
MSLESAALTPGEREILNQTVLGRHRLGEQYADLEQQSHAATTAMWVFLATEVMFFGALIVCLGVYHLKYSEAFEKTSAQLNWVIGGINTIVLLCSSWTMVMAVHFAKLGIRKLIVLFLGATALLGAVFLALKGYEYYLDYRENLIPGWRFNPEEWTTQQGLLPDQVPQVKLFLMFYWILTPIHALHLTLGIIAVLIVMGLARKSHLSPVYYSPVEVLGLYWHFVDVVWIFLLPMLYLLGTHTLQR